MIDEIKQRIEQIKAGRTPEGYRRTKAGIMPDDWELKEASEYFYNYSNKTHNGQGEVLSVTQDKGVIPRNQIEIDIKYNQDSLDTYKYVESGDFIISLRSFQGGIEYSEYNGLVSPAYTVLKNKVELNKGFYKHYFKTQDFIKRLNKATYGIRDGKQIGYDDFASLELHFPSLPEQNRINEILSTWDKVIELKERLINEKKRQKKWLIQKLLNPKSGVRLPGFKDDWDFVKLNEVVGLSTEKYNPIISDIDYICIELEHIEPFSGRLIGYTSSKRQKSIKNVFHKGQVLFGKLRPYLRKYLKPEFDGVCSTEIWVFDCKTKRIIGDFLFYLVQSDNFINNANLSSGSKMPRADWDHVRNITIPLPSIPEQTAIAQILSTADREIELLEKELEETKLQKKALMQLLLTGIVRVNDQLAMSN